MFSTAFTWKRNSGVGREAYNGVDKREDYLKKKTIISVKSN